MGQQPNYLITEVPWEEEYYGTSREKLYEEYATMAADRPRGEYSPEDLEARKLEVLHRFTSSWDVELPWDDHIFDLCRALARYEHERHKYESIEGDFEQVTILCLDMFLRKLQKAGAKAWDEWRKADSSGEKPSTVKVAITATERDCLIEAARYCSGEDFGFEDVGWAAVVPRDEVKPLAKQLELLLYTNHPPEPCESIFENTLC